MDFKPFKQVVSFQDETEFTLQAKELDALIVLKESYNIPSVNDIFDNMIARFIKEKKIEIKYIDYQDNEMTKQEVEKMVNSVLQQIKFDNTTIEPEL